MSSKPKSKTFSVLLYGGSVQKNKDGFVPSYRRANICLSKYYVGARNIKEAEEFTRKKVGKYKRCRVHKQYDADIIPYGKVKTFSDLTQNEIKPILEMEKEQAKQIHKEAVIR